MRTANPEIDAVATTSPDWASTIKGDNPEIIEVATMPSVRNNSYESIKPWIDFCLAAALLLLLAPIILLGLILVRLSSRGPLTYTQKRLGLGGTVFTIYKLRTMYEDSERDGVARWCLPGDPRITPIGWWLRWTHVDELPQLINVLKGEMSLVGPRPERPEFLHQLERALTNYRERLTVRPGITGLAQLQLPPDRDLSSVRRKLNCDLCYVEWISAWLDIRLMFGTVLKCLGVPFVWIGRILQLPDPNAHPGCESLLTNPS